jgi:hypothetical protein
MIDVIWNTLILGYALTHDEAYYLTRNSIEFLRSIEPLDFDPELANDYLDCFQSDAAKAFVVGEVETLYGEMENPADRLKTMDLISNPNVYFDSPDSDEVIS